MPNPELTENKEETAEQGEISTDEYTSAMDSAEVVIFEEDSVEVIRSRIQEAIDLSDAGGVVTVSGSKTEANIRLSLVIPSGKKIVWRADYSEIAAIGDNNDMIFISGSGEFEIAGGIIQTNSRNGRGLLSYCNTTINGGTIKSTTGTAVSASGGSVTMNGGEVSTTSGTALYSSREITINGGRISATSGTAVHSYVDTITVNGGTISTTTGVAIRKNNSGNAIVNEGIISSASGIAIYSNGNGNITVNNGYISTVSGRAIAVVPSSYGLVNLIVKGGTVITTDFGIAIDTSSGSSYASVRVRIEGGLVFSYGSSVVNNNNLINAYPSYITGPEGDGILIAWNIGAGNTSYVTGTETDIAKSPAAVSAIWSRVGEECGILYDNGNVSGFIALPVGVSETGVGENTDVTISQADSVETIQNAIQYAVDSVPYGDSITVKGDKSGAGDTLNLHIPSGKKLYWEADYSGALSDSSSLIRLTGRGGFELTGGILRLTVTRVSSVISAGDSYFRLMISGGEIRCERTEGTFSHSSVSISGAYSSVVMQGGAVLSTGIAINSSGAYSSIRITDGVISSESYAIYASGNNSRINIDGGSVSAVTGTTVYSGGMQNSVAVSGGSVSALKSDAIHMSSASSPVVTISGGNISSAEGNAVSSYANNTRITISGGRVTAAGGRAVYAPYSNTSVTVSGGVVFAYGRTIKDVVEIDDPTRIYVPAGGGMLVSWDADEDVAEYYTGEGKHLFVYPDSTSARWAAQDGSYGIVCENGVNAWFVPLPVVVSPTGAPGISGPRAIALAVGYDSLSSEPFTITGNDYSIILVSGDAKITWNEGAHCLDIAAGLSAGSYTATLRAENEAGAVDFTITITVYLSHEVIISQNDTTLEIAERIANALNGAQIGEVVSVTGEKTGVAYWLNLSIPKGKRVIWKADYQSAFDYDGNLIDVYGEGELEIAGGTISSVFGNAINMLYSGAVLYVNGGKITTFYGSALVGYRIIINNGQIKAYGDQITAVNAPYIMMKGGSVEAIGYASTALGTSRRNASVVIKGGTISTAGHDASAVSISGINASIDISGGSVIAASSAALCSFGEYSTITVHGGVVSGKHGICAYGHVTAVSVNGGIVAANDLQSGRAIYAKGVFSTVAVYGGAVVGHGSKTVGYRTFEAADCAIYIENGLENFTGPKKDGMIIAWNSGGGNTIYMPGAGKDIAALPAEADAKWAAAGGKRGILFSNGENKGFVPLPVTVLVGYVLNKNYLIIKKGESCALTAYDPEDPENPVLAEWASSNDEIAVVDQNGLVTAIRGGTAVITAFSREYDMLSECRVDVIEMPAGEAVTGVRLLKSTITTNVLSTDYAKVPIQLVLEQNLPKITGYEQPQNTSAAETSSISSISFVNPEVERYFTPVPIDDRYVELVPKDDIIDAIKIKQLKTKLVVTVDGVNMETKDLTIKISRSKPILKAGSIKFNSFFPEEEHLVKITSSLGAVKDISLLAVNDHDQVIFNEKTEYLRLTNANSNPKKLVFSVTVSGFAKPFEVVLKTSASMKKPTVKLSVKSVRMYYEAWLGITGPGIKSVRVTDNNDYDIFYFSGSSFMLFYKRITVGETVNKDTKLNLEISFDKTDQTVTIPLTVNKPGSKVSVKLSKKTVTLNTLFSYEDFDFYETVYFTTNPVDGWPDELYYNEDVLDISYNENDNGKWLEIRIADLEYARPGKSYKVKLGGATLTVKLVFAAPSVSIKSKGTINVIDPASTVTLTPTFKNHSYRDAEIFVDNPNFEIVSIGATGAVTLKLASQTVQSGQKQRVSLAYCDEWGVYISKPITITPKQGKVKINQSIKQVHLQKNDIHGEDMLEISVLSPKAANITGVVVSPKDKNFEKFNIRMIHNNVYAIGFRNHVIGNVSSRTTVNLDVYIAGSDKPVPIKLTILIE